MELDFNKIIRLKKIRIEKSELSEEENTLASPILRDKSLIRDIYKIFVELLNSRSLPLVLIVLPSGRSSSSLSCTCFLQVRLPVGK